MTDTPGNQFTISIERKLLAELQGNVGLLGAGGLLLIIVLLMSMFLLIMLLRRQMVVITPIYHLKKKSILSLAGTQ